MNPSHKPTNSHPVATEVSLASNPHTQSPSTQEPKNKPSTKWLKVAGFVALGLGVIMVAFGIWFLMALTSIQADKSVDGTVFVVSEGSSIDTIANELYSQKLITSPLVFSLYAKLGPARGSLQPGPYLIKPTNSIAHIIGDMNTGRIAISKITFPEGITIESMAKRFESAGYGSADSYLQATKKLAQEYSFVPAEAKANPEGYLFPATYTFTINSPADVLVRKQYEAFEEYMAPLLSQALPSNLTPYEALTLASVVEKEGTTTKDRKLIAGVFLNRLRTGMRLESDVTINYITGKTATQAVDLTIVSRYNSYKNFGLPPTPICNPSTDALEAVINPTPNEYIFFLAGKDGTVYYAKTLQEHNENIKKHL